MPVGTVKLFSTTEGFGLIQPDGGGPDVFVHISAVEQAGIHRLREGQRVSFELKPGRQGQISAVNLRQA